MPSRGMHGRGICGRGLNGRGHAWKGSVHGRGGMHGRGHSRQERQPLQRAVRILLERILVSLICQLWPIKAKITATLKQGSSMAAEPFRSTYFRTSIGRAYWLSCSATKKSSGVTPMVNRKNPLQAGIEICG